METAVNYLLQLFGKNTIFTQTCIINEVIWYFWTGICQQKLAKLYPSTLNYRVDKFLLFEKKKVFYEIGQSLL